MFTADWSGMLISQANLGTEQMWGAAVILVNQIFDCISRNNLVCFAHWNFTWLVFLLNFGTNISKAKFYIKKKKKTRQYGLFAYCIKLTVPQSK